MFKLGIYKKEQLNIAHLESFWGKRQFIAQDLYDQLQDYSPEERTYCQEKILIRFSVGNGVFKYTSSARFDDFDEQAIKILRENFPAGDSLKLHDIGVSDGRTSCSLFSQLNHIYKEHLDFLASDYAPCLFVVRKKGSTRRIILNEQNEIMQIVFPPFVFFCIHPESKLFYPLNFIVRMMVDKFYAKPLCEQHLKGTDAGIEVKKVMLLCPGFKILMKENPNLHFEQQDILNMPETCFHVIRVMNLLNEGYFPDKLLQQATRNVLSSLTEGGIFIVGSNREQGTVVDGGIYQKTTDGVKCLYKSGQGPVVEKWIMAYKEERKVA